MFYDVQALPTLRLCKTISFQSTTPKRHSVVEARIRVLEHLCPGLIRILHDWVRNDELLEMSRRLDPRRGIEQGRTLKLITG